MTDIDVDRYQGPLREATPSGHVGFDSLPDQVVNKATGAGFCFNILCVGETGIGKRYSKFNNRDTIFNSYGRRFQQYGLSGNVFNHFHSLISS